MAGLVDKNDHEQGMDFTSEQMRSGWKPSTIMVGTPVAQWKGLVPALDLTVLLGSQGTSSAHLVLASRLENCCSRQLSAPISVAWYKLRHYGNKNMMK